MRFRVAAVLALGFGESDVISFGIGFPEFAFSVAAMEEESKEPSRIRTLYLPVGVATVFAAGLWFAIPEVGALAVGSAWVGTVLFMSIWGSFYS